MGAMILGTLLGALSGCDPAPTPDSGDDDAPATDVDTDTDADTDTGADADTDSDSDADADADADSDSDSDTDTDDDTGASGTTDPSPEGFPMFGSLSIYSEGRWAADETTMLFCDTLYNFTGHAYVGECDGCNFEWELDTVEFTEAGSECIAADYVGLSVDRPLVQSDMLLNFNEEAGYSYGFHDSLGIRWGPEQYSFFRSRPYLPTGIDREDGLLTWSGTSFYWDHHAGELSEEVAHHHYSYPHAWPMEFRRDTNLEIHYTVCESPGD